MKKGSTWFLRGAVIVMGVGALALCIFALPAFWQGGQQEFPTATFAIKLIVIGMYVAALPFYLVLWQTLRLLSYIDNNQAFSEMSVKALKNIKHFATVMGAIYVAGIPLLYPIADADDAPGLILFGTVFAFAPVTVAVFAAVLQRLLQSAIEMKSENELTV